MNLSLKKKFKSVVATILTGSLLLANTGLVHSAEKTPAFKDIKGSFAEKAIISLTSEGIIQGINAEQFAPAQNVTRLQFGVLLAKSLGVQPFFPAKPTFSDLAPGTLETGYVEALAKLGIVKGTGKNLYGAKNPILRQDVSVLLYKVLEMNPQSTALPNGKFKDQNRISAYALSSVAYMSLNSWMNGSGGYFYPLKNLTRAEAAVLIEKLFNNRKQQALKALQQPVEELGVGTGKTADIEVQAEKYPVVFTAVYGSDNRFINQVSAKGKVTAGLTEGTGTVTVNGGRNAYPVKINVKESPEETALESVYDSGTGITAVPALESEPQSKDLQIDYTVSQHSPDPGFQSTEYKSYSGPVEGITSKSDAWTGFLRQQGRDIVVDLKKLNTLSGLSLEFKQDANSGVYVPKTLTASVSADGVSWYQLGQVYHGIDSSDKTVQNLNLSLNFPSVTTRYVKLTFPVDVWVLARHLTVKGGLQAEAPAVLAPAVKSTGADNGNTYLQNTDFKDIFLVYTGDKTPQQTLNSDDFMPLVAYVDQQGQVKGRMFDTMLFLPYNGMPCTKDSWTAYMEDLFVPGQQLYALEETMSKLNQKTGVQDKEKVVLALPYPDSKQMDFGDLEQTAKGRFDAVQWYYGELMNKWNSAGFKNLTLSGIYWYGETINKNIAGEEELVKNVGQMVRGNGQNFVWIPSYGAMGLSEWKSYGFTHVYLQPNYYGNQDAPADRMDKAAEQAKKYSTGIEVELDNRVLTTRYYYDLFYNELNKGHQLGFDQNVSNAYYVGLKKTVLDSVSSGTPQIRSIYDDLYRWISGTFN